MSDTLQEHVERLQQEKKDYSSEMERLKDEEAVEKSSIKELEKKVQDK